MLSKALWGGSYSCPQFTDEQTEAQCHTDSKRQSWVWLPGTLTVHDSMLDVKMEGPSAEKLLHRYLPSLSDGVSLLSKSFTTLKERGGPPSLTHTPNLASVSKMVKWAADETLAGLKLAGCAWSLDDRRAREVPPASGYCLQGRVEVGRLHPKSLHLPWGLPSSHKPALPFGPSLGEGGGGSVFL